MPFNTNITYNQYGERQRIDYGNGTFTEYDYDDLRRMQNLGHQFFGATSTYTVEKEYAYDKVSNVIQIETLNNGQLEPNTKDGVLAGPILHNYYYDDFNRLIKADGWYVGPDDEPSALLRQEYTLDMRYDESHNILNKAQNHLRGSGDPNDTSIFLNNLVPEAMEDTAYNLDYEDYASGSFTAGGHSYVQPHAPRTIVEYPFGAGAEEPSAKRKLLDYDANGNLLLVEQEISDPEDPLGKAKISLRENLWDEEDRLRAVDLKPEAPGNKPEVAAYTYDASGERSIKYLPGRLDAYYSAKAAGSADRLESILYPSPLLTVKTRPLPEDMSMDLLQETSITKYTKHYYIGTERIASALGTMNNIGLLCENVWPGSQDIIDEMGGKTMIATEVLEAIHDTFEKELQLPEPYLYETYICTKLEHEPDNYDAYWYHPDHLGSSSYITNLAGDVSQHMEYLPFGETLVEEHLNSYNSPYKFNAKEFDAETGNYYYGARYFNPRTSVWLSVDPASEMYPSFSPYAYTFQNPLRYVDPTGMFVEDPPTEAGTNEGQIYTDPDNGVVYEWDGKGAWHTAGGGELDEVVVTASSNPNDISNGADSHIVPSFGVSQDLGAIGSTTNGGLALPQDFGSWDRVGSDGRQWIGCMACHGNNGAYRTLAYNSPSRYTGLSLAATFNAAFMYGQTVTAKGVTAPKGWITKASGKGGGVKFVDPKNPHNQIRQMPGNPNSSFPAQQNPYIKYMKDGKFYDVGGNPLPSGNVPEAHIPLNQFNINNMPKF